MPLSSIVQQVRGHLAASFSYAQVYMVATAEMHCWYKACFAHVFGGRVSTNYFLVLFQNPAMVAATSAWPGTVAGSQTGCTERHR